MNVDNRLKICSAPGGVYRWKNLQEKLDFLEKYFNLMKDMFKALRNSVNAKQERKKKNALSVSYQSHKNQKINS